MTVAIGFYCKDGVVIGADSMLTPNVGGLNVGHHKGVKVHLLDGKQIFAFAGDLGQALRFQQLASGGYSSVADLKNAFDYPLNLTANIINQFTATGIRDAINVSALLGFIHRDDCQLCVFEENLQPRLLDEYHYYVALGSGKLSADPFLRFLVDIFCVDGQPTVQEAVWLTTWVMEHVCKVNPGGVAPPLRISVIERGEDNSWKARSLTDDEIDDHRQSIVSAEGELRTWREALASEPRGEIRTHLPPIPQIEEDQSVSGDDINSFHVPESVEGCSD